MTPDPKIKRVAGLLQAANGRSCERFIEQCSQAKILSLFDPSRAIEEYRSLANQALITESMTGNANCQDAIHVAIESLSRGVVDKRYLKALEKLKEVYFERVLRPAVHSYIETGTGQLSKMRSLYDNALKIDSLLHVAEFLTRATPYSDSSDEP